MTEETTQADPTSALGIFSNEDMATVKKFLPFMMPVVSPWATLGAGALMGLYQNHERKKDLERQIKLNATLAEISPWANVQPQTSFENPSVVGDMLGGVAAAQGVSNSINQYSPAINLWKHLSDKEKVVDPTLQAMEIPENMRPARDMGLMGSDPYMETQVDTNAYLGRGYPYNTYLETPTLESGEPRGWFEPVGPIPTRRY